ncbi:MAG: TonB-dependent hemoglobin/transferrin/lactoferrin family receptor [Pseudomonadota bacterium]
MSRNSSTEGCRSGGKPSCGIRSSLLCATSIVSWLMASAVFTYATAPVAAQQSESELRTFNISSQPLGSAVAVFGRQSGLQVSLAAATAAGIKTNAVNGTMDAYSALTELLSGTGLYWWLSEDGAVIIATSGSPSGLNETGANQLDLIRISNEAGRGYRGTPDWVYETPSSVSVVTREAIEETGIRDTRRIFDAVSGVYSGDGVGSFPTVSPNIRGLQDSGRVIVSIDGARLNAQDGGRYGGTDIGGIGMAFVDTSFVREVDIQKSTRAAANNAGSLSGATDFRLVGAADIITPGNTWGIEVNSSAGSNAYEFDGSVIGSMFLGESIALTLGASRKQMGQYEPGQYGDVEARYDLTDQNNLSTFVKLEAEFEDVSASVSWLHQLNKFSYDTTVGGFGSNFDARTDTVVADLGWAPDNPWVNIAGKVWLNSSVIDETRDARNSAPKTYIDKELTSFGFVLENTSEIATTIGNLNLNYGVEAFRDSANKNASSSSIDLNPLYASSYGSFSPAGRRDIASAFLNGTIQPVDWVSLSGGLRYDWYRTKGSATYYDTTTQTTRNVAGSITSYWDFVLATWTPAEIATISPFLIPFLQTQMGEVVDGTFHLAGTIISTSTSTIVDAHTDNIDRSDGAWLPSATIEFKPFSWLMPFASYSQSYRPPTITESFASGAVIPSDNIGVNFAANTALRPEKARTYELGANVVVDQLFSDQDRVRLKIVGFYREVDDYIVLGSIIKDGEPDRTYNSFVNLDGTARMRGIEVEGNYDANFFWFGASTTLLDISWPQTTETFDNGTVSTDGQIFAWNSSVPPRFKLTLDTGIRLFEERLALGARMNHVSPTSSARLTNDGDVIEYSESYTTLDLYGSYQFNDHALLRVSANNVTDINYIPATGVYQAPGRTLQASLKLRF